MIDRRAVIAAAPAALTLPTLAQEPGLAAYARAAGLQFGCAVGPWLWNEREFRQAVLRDCSLIVPEYEWKWDHLAPTPRRTELRVLKRYLDFADKHALAVRGHTLVWHRSMPKWFPASADKATAIRLMTDHIHTLVGFGAGRVPWWDVINEGIEPADGRRDGLRRTPLLRLIGPDYIEIAYRAAAEADPSARLVYNDFGLGKAWGEARRGAVLKMLEQLVASGTPIHAVGLQSHLKVGENTVDPKRLLWFGERVRELGLDLLVTELDVAPADDGSSDTQVAAVYAEYLETVLQLPNLKSVSTWGLSDRYSWLTQAAGSRARPLLYDDKMRRKAAWDAVAQALRQRAL